MPRRQRSGEERNAIILEAMGHGLIRFRGHGATVTFETTLPLSEAVQAVSRFMAEHFGPLTMVQLNRIPSGPCVAIYYQDLAGAMARGDLGSILPADPQVRRMVTP